MQKKYRRFLTLLAFVFVVSSTIAYSALTTSLNLTAEAKLRTISDIRVTGISLSSANGGTLQYESVYDVNTITSGFKLPTTDASITYKVTVTNNGTIDQTIYDILTQSTNNNGLYYTISGYNVRDVIGFKSYVEFYITYKTTTPSNDVINVVNRFNFKKVYHLTFETNGGTTIPEGNKYEGVDLSLSSFTTTKTGYTLAGWTDEQDGTTVKYQTNGTYTLDQNKILYAIWAPSNNTAYTVNHYVHDLGTNTYTLDSTDNLTGTTDSTVTLANLKKTIAGFTYVDGYLTGGTTKPTSGAVTTTTILADGSRVINLYYRRNYLYVQYHVNGGQLAEQHGSHFGITNSLVTSTGNTTPNKFWVGVYGSKVNAVTNANTYTQGTAGLDNYNNPNYLNLEKTGYTGKSGQEWNTNASGTGTSYSQATTTYDANTFGGADLSTGDQVVTLYVNWVPVNYEITYDLQGGTLAPSNPATYNIESNTITLNNPTMTGYTFTGWTGSNGNVPETSVTIPAGSTGDKAYVANWQANSYTVTYDTDGGLISGDRVFNFDGSTQTIDGTINGATWGTDYLQFAGNSSSWVNLGKMNYDYMTLQATFSVDETVNSTQDVIGNLEQGGGSIHIQNHEGQYIIAGQFYIGNSYKTIYSDIVPEVGKKYNVILSYNGEVEKLYINNTLIGTIEVSGTIKAPTNNTVMVLGGNPQGSEMWSESFKGKIYNASIYSNTKKQVTYDSPYGTLPTPTRTGYTFLGWNGKNKFNKEEYLNYDDYINLTEITTPQYLGKIINLKSNTTYKVSVNYLNNFNGKNNSYLFISDVPAINGYTWTSVAHTTEGNYSAVNSLYTTDSNGILYIGRYRGMTIQQLETIWTNTNVQIEEGTTATPYEPYYVTSSTQVTQAKDHVLTAKWELKEAKLIAGPNFAVKIKSLANPSLENVTAYTADNNITSIQKYTSTPSSSILENAEIVSTNDSNTPVYAWYDNGTIYYYSEAVNIYLNENISQMFYNLRGIESIDLSNFNSSKTTNMSTVFANSVNLSSITFGNNFDTSHATSMKEMFYNTGLTSLDLSGFNTSNVTDMSSMFSFCSVSSLNLSSFNTSNVQNMSQMFYGASNLTSLNLSNFNTTNVTNMYGMFGQLTNLEFINVSSFDTSKVTNMSKMFYNIARNTAISLDLSNFNTELVTTMEEMFYQGHITSLDISSFDMSVVTNTTYMFRGLASLQSLKTPDTYPADTSVTITLPKLMVDASGNEYTELNSSSPTETWLYTPATFLPGQEFNAKIKQLAGNANATYSTADTNIISIARANVLPNGFAPTPANVVSISDSYYPIYAWYDNGTIYYYTEYSNPYMNSSGAYMFYNLSNVTTIDVSAIDTSKTTSMYAIFHSCVKLSSLDLSSFDTTRVTNMRGMFAYNRKLEELDLSSFNMENVEDVTYYLLENYSLQKLKTPNTYPTDPSVTITLPASFHTESGTGYSTLTSTSPTETWLYKSLCIRATTLHTETCSQTSDSLYCSGAGYKVGGSKNTSTITYGNLGTNSSTLNSGDAFTCDVNGDGVYNETNERFYYVSDYYNTTTKQFESDTGVLVYYNSVSGGIANNTAKYAYDSSGENWHGPQTAILQLPTSLQWSNISPKNNARAVLSNTSGDTTTGGTLPSDFSYSGYSTRLLTMQEVQNGCGQQSTSDNGLLGCNYALENTAFSQSSLPIGYWLETPTSSNGVHSMMVAGNYNKVGLGTVSLTNNISVRPAIEINKNNINKTVYSYLITYDTNGGSENSTSTISVGDTLGTLPTPTRVGYTFNGWYTDPTNGAQVTSSTVPTGSTTYYAHWTMDVYTITADANGGSIPSTTGWTGTGNTVTKQLSYGQTYGELPTPTRSGYVFDGWNGKNKLSIPASYLTGADIRDMTIDNMQFIKAGTYTFTREVNNATTWRDAIILKDTSGNNITDSNPNPASFYYSSSVGTWLAGSDDFVNVNSYQITIAQDCYIRIGIAYGDASGATVTAQLEEGTTATPYEPYYVTSSTQVTQDHNHTLTAKWTTIYDPETRIRALNTIGTSIADDDPDGNLRFIGANPNNYVSFNGQTWRIIGVIDGRLKLIQNSIGNYSWDTSKNDVNNGLGVNQWGPSGVYTGSDLMKLLNPGYENNTDLKCNTNTTLTSGVVNCGDNSSSNYTSDLVNNSLWWNGQSGYCYNYGNYQVTSCNFTAIGLKSNISRNMIDTSTWYLGGSLINENIFDGRMTASYIYNMEHSNLTGKQCLNGSGCNDTVDRTSIWQGKVGLISLSDYTYATSGGTTYDRNTCLTTHVGYPNSSVQNWSNTYTDCKNNDWLTPTSGTVWSLSPYGSTAYSMFYISSYISYYHAMSTSTIRPVVYLKSSVKITGGDGSSGNPFTLRDTDEATTQLITLDNKGASTEGTKKVFVKYNTGYYLDSKTTTQMTTSTNGITVPTRTGYQFEGYYTAETGGVQYIGANGKLTSNASATNFQTDGTLYAHWSRVMAENISYDNTNTGANCSDVQCMLDLIAQMLDS